MHTDSTLSLGQARNGFLALLGLVLGSALQLQQIDLFAWQIYMVFVLLALVGYMCAASKTIATNKRMGLALVALALLGFGATGLRANAYLVDGLNPALEGRDLRVTGVVTNLPQRSRLVCAFALKWSPLLWMAREPTCRRAWMLPGMANPPCPQPD